MEACFYCQDCHQPHYIMHEKIYLPAFHNNHDTAPPTSPCEVRPGPVMLQLVYDYSGITFRFLHLSLFPTIIQKSLLYRAVLLTSNTGNQFFSFFLPQQLQCRWTLLHRSSLSRCRLLQIYPAYPLLFSPLVIPGSKYSAIVPAGIQIPLCRFSGSFVPNRKANIYPYPASPERL